MTDEGNITDAADILAIIDQWMESYDFMGTGSIGSADLAQAEWLQDRAKIAAFLSASRVHPAGEPVARAGFPILRSGGQTIDWQLVADHGKQAEANHYQTVKRLAERGGLAWTELHAVLHNRPYQPMDENEAMIACRALEARYLEALTPGSPL